MSFNFFRLMISELEKASWMMNKGTHAKKIKMVVGANHPELNKSPLRMDNKRNCVFCNMG